MESILGERFQHLIFIGISLLVFIFVTILYFADRQIFQRFIGKINPLAGFLLVILIGYILLTFLLSQRWFTIFETENLRGMILFSGLAALLGIIMILADTKIIFPDDTNILFPKSLLFYPAIGFLVEILFHVLPLAVLLFILNIIFRGTHFGVTVWVVIVMVSFIEPIYQTVNMASSNQHPVWAVIFVGFHILLINFCQLLIFKKYDFVSMYAFRFVYYLFWHVGWGFWRLKLLF